VVLAMITGSLLSQSGFKGPKRNSYMDDRIGFKSNELRKEFTSLVLISLCTESGIYFYYLEKLLCFLVDDIKRERNLTTLKIAKLIDINPRSFYYYLEGKRPIPAKHLSLLLDLSEQKIVALLDIFEVYSLWVSCGSGIRKKLVKIPLCVSLDLFYLLGYLFGDGCLHSQKWIVSFVDEYSEQILKVNRLFRNLFYVKGVLIESKGKTELRVYSKALLLFFNKIFNMTRGEKKGLLYLPPILQKLPLSYSLSFFARSMSAKR